METTLSSTSLDANMTTLSSKIRLIITIHFPFLILAVLFQVLDYEWEDHHSPPINTLFIICQRIHRFLQSIFIISSPIPSSKKHILTTTKKFLNRKDRQRSDNSLLGWQGKNRDYYMLLHDLFWQILNCIGRSSVLWKEAVMLVAIRTIINSFFLLDFYKKVQE